AEKKDGNLPPTETLLKVTQKPKGMKSKLSGWSRLKQHMVVEQEEPEFPQLDSKKEATEVSGEAPSEAKKIEQEEPKAREKVVDGDEKEDAAPPIATKMWDAVLFQMFSSEEKIIQQIEANKKEEEKEKQEESKEIPSFAHRLPVLLFSPRFDAKRLKEAASRPLTKMSTVFEMGLIGRKEEEPKDFNRTARGFTVS
ncbi:proline-rich protein 33, partial [Aplochiton taeniatus]